MPALTDIKRRVFVDGKDKGEVFRAHGRWFWRRGASGLSVDPMPPRANLADLAEWARKCCNGDKAVVKVVR